MTDHTTLPGRNSHGTVRLADLPDATIPSNADSLAARDALSAVLATAPGSWQRADAAADLLAVLGVPVSDLLQPEPEPELAPRGWSVVEGDSRSEPEPELAPRGWSVVEGDSGATGEYL